MKNKIFIQLTNLNLISFANMNYLIFISIFVILMRIFIYDLTLHHLKEQIYETKDLNIFQDISKRIRFSLFICQLVLSFSNFCITTII